MDEKRKNFSVDLAKEDKMAFGRDNYKFLIIGLIVIAIGYILMIGGGSDDPNVFNEAIFDFQRLTLAPIVIIIGFIIEGYAILKKPKK
ncbi:MAG: DUF3098 domain-containing protein [Hyphomicrobiales bacterium]